MRKFLVLMVSILAIGLAGCSQVTELPKGIQNNDISDNYFNENSGITKQEADNIVSKAEFNGFVNDMFDVQERFQVAMLSAKSNEEKKGNDRTDAQLYNYVARGGKKVIIEENDWLLQNEAENIACTIINSEYAGNTIGLDLPISKATDSNGTKVQVSYYITPNGEVFSWPPHEYDGKSYVSYDVIVKDKKGNDLSNLKAVTEKEVIIYFKDTNEVVIVKNGSKTEFEKGKIKDIAKFDLNDEELNQEQISQLNYNIEGPIPITTGSQIKFFINQINMYNSKNIFPVQLKINDYTDSNVILIDGEYSVGNLIDSYKYDLSFEYREDGLITEININR